MDYRMSDGSEIIGHCMPNMEFVEYSKEFIRYQANVLKNVMIKMFQRSEEQIPSDCSLTIESFKQAAKTFSESLEQNPCPEVIKDILEHDYRKKDQERKLRGLTITIGQLNSIFFQAETLGYKFSNFRYEGKPKNIPEKDLPRLVYINDDGNPIVDGGENLSEGQLKALVNDNDVKITRIFTKGDNWHCFLQTFKGLKGQESGTQGVCSHIHYFSNKFCNLSYEELKTIILSGRYPNAPVHIPLVES